MPINLKPNYQMKNLLFIFLLVVAYTTSAQKVKLVEGSLKPLKDQKSIKTKFTYDNMIVGKDLTEEAYIDRKKKEYNEKEAGRGDKWEKAWYNDRENRFEPQFEELFEKYANLIPTSSDEPTYMMIFHTTRTEPGWNVGVARVPARIDGEVIIVETANPDKVIARITVTKAPGRDAWGLDFDTGLRLQEAYAKSGKEVGQLIAKAKK